MRKLLLAFLVLCVAAPSHAWFLKKKAAGGGGGGQTITLRDTHKNTAGAATSAVIVKPDGLAVGDMMVAIIYKENIEALNSVPSGFTTLTSATTAGDVAKMWVYTKVADAGDVAASNFTFGWATSAYQAALLSAFTSAGTISVDTSSTNAGDGTNSANAVALSVTTAVTNCMLVYAASNYNGGTWTPPTDFSEHANGENGVAYTATYSQAAAGASGNKTGVCSASDDWSAILVSLKAL